ncbi:MAG: winged helix-turn-helix domain-containing protein [Nitrososphaerales archaeon]
MDSSVEKESIHAAYFRNRSRIEIMSAVLEAAKISSPKMHLIYAARLSHKIGSEYVARLVKQDLLEAVSLTMDSGKEMFLYRTSGLGKKFLDFYAELEKLTEVAQPAEKAKGLVEIISISS